MIDNLTRYIVATFNYHFDETFNTDDFIGLIEICIRTEYLESILKVCI